MATWRMAFRVGSDGQELWPRCLDLGVAAITYKALEDVDLSKFSYREPKKLWDQLESSQKSSLSKVAYEMKKGDVIYVKQGPYIISRGVVEDNYAFDSQDRVIDHRNVAWRHQVPVKWERNFIKVRVLLGAELSTVKELTEKNLNDLYRAMGKTPDS